MKILVIGGSGMLGYSMFTTLSENPDFEVFATLRVKLPSDFPHSENVFTNVELTKFDTVIRVVERLKPDVVINCAGIIKQHEISNSYTHSIEINSLFPHKLAELCSTHNTKMIHFSTDCIFSGNTGLYLESDIPDSDALYGKSKALGEVDYGNHLTLRTSIIGHELNTCVSLIDWFLNQEGKVKGFTKAIFSGLPAHFISKIISEKLMEMENISGLYHLSSDPINKYDLLKLVATRYGKNISIEKSDEFVIDRSLVSDRLKNELRLDIPSWDELVSDMYSDYLNKYANKK
ncbi:NAD(P)-dependent oxidoreductase [Vibrio sp. 10N.286.49.C2]|uniref:dTDP-4-dehydrorhamnose reductase family protein n=1 Tax=unclassified Vibrio TaxID=2614977 RepID=UPI000C82C032|nr:MULTISPECIES: SDR family oxidoreductase [unclassified Vibrio]PMH32139.1 NAD(P)-dependent oxidoreductase [Vibrio sp. 10N.286.49.C2]PMH47966.1 NAD(P)-dependent oxidoreductase [Vibrio sp. 10N.286.49.B1]